MTIKTDFMTFEDETIDSEAIYARLNDREYIRDTIRTTVISLTLDRSFAVILNEFFDSLDCINNVAGPMLSN